MNLKQLEAYRAVATSGSTIAAAEALKISQSAVSRLLRQLETALGIELFARDKNRLIPTPEALRLFDDIDHAIESVHRVGRLAEEMRLGVRPVQVRVALPASVVEHTMPGVLRSFHARWPAAAVEVLNGSYEVIERLLAEGRADLGLVRAPVANGALTVVTPTAVPIVCVVAADHPLAARSVVRAVDLTGVPLILTGREQASRLEVERVLRRHGVVPLVRLELHSVAAACTHAAAGLGATLVNDAMAQACAVPGAVIRPFRPRLVRQLALAGPPARPLEGVTGALAEALDQALLARYRADGLSAPPIEN